MCRSKKDGRRGGAHKPGIYSKWRVQKARRRHRIARRASRELVLAEFEDAAQAAEPELQQDFFETQDEWEWTQDYVNYSDRHAMDFYDDLDYDRYDYNYGSMDRDYMDTVVPEPAPRSDLFLAVDRAVRRHGVQYVWDNVTLLAAALDVSSWEVQRCINFTRDGYIRRSW